MNKYLLAVVFFVAWMLFFDQKDVFTQWQRRQELKRLEAKKHYYETEIERSRKELADLQHGGPALEKFARERYLMKKEGEDIYVIDPDSSSKRQPVQQ